MFFSSSHFVFSLESNQYVDEVIGQVEVYIYMYIYTCKLLLKMWPIVCVCVCVKEKVVVPQEKPTGDSPQSWAVKVCNGYTVALLTIHCVCVCVTG